MSFCSRCGHPIEAGSSFCVKCGRAITPTTQAAPSWKDKENLRAGIGIIGTLAIVITFAAIIGSKNSSSPPSGASPVQTPVAEVNDDASLLISRCGKPDIDDSTVYDNPRPPMMSRMLTYKKARLRFAYIQRDGHVGDPPPYTWKMIGIVDTRNETAISAPALKATLTKRLPCSLPH